MEHVKKSYRKCPDRQENCPFGEKWNTMFIAIEH
jgi:hypothetical protein